MPAMRFGLPASLTLYDLLKDQGSLIGGLLALGAGWLAYRAGLKQASVARDQTAELRRQEQRRVARDSLQAVTSLLAVLVQSQSDIREAIQKVSDWIPQNATVDNETKPLVFTPDIATVWASLGLTKTEFAQAYIRFDRRLADFNHPVDSRPEASEPAKTRTTARWQMNELVKLGEMVDALVIELSQHSIELKNKLIEPT